MTAGPSTSHYPRRCPCEGTGIIGNAIMKCRCNGDGSDDDWLGFAQRHRRGLETALLAAAVALGFGAALAVANPQEASVGSRGASGDYELVTIPPARERICAKSLETCMDAQRAIRDFGLFRELGITQTWCLPAKDCFTQDSLIKRKNGQ